MDTGETLQFFLLIRFLFAYNSLNCSPCGSQSGHCRRNQMALTRRQKQVLDFLVHFINRHGYSPSFEEMASGLHLSSLATVHKHLQVLEKKGFIRRRYNQSRSVEVIAVPGSVPYGKEFMQTGAGQPASGHAPLPAMPSDSIHFHPLPNLDFP